MYYSPRPDAPGLFDVQMPDGNTMPLALSEEQLQAQGFQPAPPAPDQRLAMAGSGGSGGMGNVADVPQQSPGAGGTLGSDQGSWVPGAQGRGGVDEPGRSGPPEDRPRESEEPAADPSDLRGGNRVVDLDLGAGLNQQQFSPRRTVKLSDAQDKRVAFTREPGLPISDEMIADEEMRRQKGIYDYADVEQFKARQRRLALGEQEGMLEDREKMLALEQAQRAKVDDKIAKEEYKIQELEDDAKNAKDFDAMRWWKSKGAFGKVLGILGAALGGIAQGMRGGSNPFMDMANKAMEADIMDQREEYERLREKQQDAQNDFNRMIELYGTPEAAEEAMRIKRLGWMQDKIGLHAQRIGSAEALQAANAMVTDMQRQSDESKVRLLNLQRGKIVEQWQHQPAQFATVGGRPKPEAIDRMVRLPNGEFAWARTAKGAQNSQAVMQGNSELVSILQQMRRLSEDPKSRIGGSEAWNRLKSLSSQYVLSARRAEPGVGALDKGLQGLLEQSAADPSVFRAPGIRHRIDQSIELRKGQIQTEMRYNLHADPDASQTLLPAAPATEYK